MGLLLPFLYQCAPANSHTRQANTHKGFRPFKPTVEKASLTAQPSRSRRIALLIGINQYKDKSWHPLRFAAKDATDLAQILRQPQHGRFDKILLQIGKARTSRDAIHKAFAQLKRWNVRSDDTVFVYISGHGTLARDSHHSLRRYLVTHDTRFKDIPRTAVSIRWMRGFFGKLKSHRKVMLLATCHSGAGKSRLTRKLNSELKTLKGAFFSKPFVRVSRATIFLGVCGFGETAQESPKLRNDIYTHYFIKALRRKYDANGDGAVTVSEAHDYAKELTYLHTHGQQRPYAESDILGTDPIVLTGRKKRPGKPVIFAYNERFRGVEVRINGTPKGAFPKGITVGAGRQRVTLLSQNQRKVLFDGAVTFRQGERVDVETLFHRRMRPFGLAFTGGYQFFLQGSPADRLSADLPIVGLTFKVKHLFKAPIDLRLEFAFARSSHMLQDQDIRPQTVTEFNLGGSLVYNLRWQWFTAYLGPRLSAIYLNRQSDVHVNINDFFYSFQPGLLAGVEVKFLSRWSLFAEGRLNYTYVTTADGSPSHQGSYEVFGGMFVYF